MTLEVTFHRDTAEFLAVNYGWAAGALIERLFSMERTALFADMLLQAGFIGRYTEGDFHGKVVASGEGLTAGAVNDCFVGMVGDKKVIQLEMGVTFLLLA
eukprot:5513234-Ditylum_brightwellii.AAC.1